jgi:hypothetical protein
MARSTYIYVLHGTTGILATATVKHEMVSLIRRMDVSGCTVATHRDGQIDSHVRTVPADCFG